ncbi:unnamed protein product, partial [Didymodactylos carnosus]
DNDEVHIEAECLLSNLELENKVKSLEAETGGWRKANIDDTKNIIPTYDQIDIEKHSGEYSIRLAHAYLGHIEQERAVYTHQQFKTTIQIKNIVSRYKTTDNPKKPTVFVRFGKRKLAVMASYCTCKSGLRTAGGECAHVTASLVAFKHWKKNEDIPSFYRKAEALFIDVFDCANYKQRTKYCNIETTSGESEVNADDDEMMIE